MTHRIIPRSEWGARHRDGFGTRSLPAGVLIQHHSVTTARGSAATKTQDIASVRHVEDIGAARFGSMPYTLLVTQAGRIFQGHSTNRIGAHTRGLNTTGIGIVLIGNYESTNTITTKQRAALVWLLRYLRERGQAKATAPYQPHSQTSATACPGKNVRGQMPAIHADSKKEEDIVSQLPRLDLSGVTTNSRTWVRGAGVQTLQGLLVARGYAPANTIRGDKVDGIAGPGTRAAVVRFQKAVGFSGAGIVGPKTWGKLLGI